MMGERGLSMAHTTIMRWVQRFIPEFEKRWRKYAKPVGRSWRVDETYIKVKGRWVYLYRAVDKQGRTVDFYLSKHRDIEAAQQFFRRAVLHCRPPKKITLDGYQASHRVVEELKAEGVLPHEVEVRSNAYLNNIIEQDHRGIKSRTGPMLGFKRFDHATIVIAGIELARKIKKGQFNVHRLMKRAGDIHDMWMAVLVA